MSKEYLWEVKAANTPLLKRKCSHCNSGRFYCSEKFRMNAQKKNIDIWLIYRCIKCGGTYNMDILSRTKTELINKDLFKKFSENDKETAWEYAFSQETSRKNNVELDFDSVGYDIQHNNITLGNILNCEDKIVTFKIIYPYNFRLRLTSVIRRCLNISANQLNILADEEVISIKEKHLQKRQKVKNEDIIQLNRDKLRRIYNLWFSQ